MPFPQTPAGARRILGGWRCCERSCWWCSRRMTKRCSPAGSGRGWSGASVRRVQVIALLLKSSLGLFGFVGRRPVLLLHPGSSAGQLIAPGDHHSTSRYTLVLTFKPTSKMWGGMMWPSLETIPKTITVAVQRVVRCVELCPQALNRPDLHFEGAGNCPVVITWIGREHELYSGASPISLVEHCVTFRHDSSYRSWDLYTTGQLV